MPLGSIPVGYGCATCINGDFRRALIDEVADAIRSSDIKAAAVLSGNRNFEGRVNPLVQPSCLASPPLVVAYALAGTVDINLHTDVIGEGINGPVYLKDIWPTNAEVQAVLETCLSKEQFQEQYASASAGPARWQAISVDESDVYAWDANSTYVQEPPFFVGLSKEVSPIGTIRDAHVLVKVADSVTTDHISPAGAVAADSGRRQLSIRKWRKSKTSMAVVLFGNDRMLLGAARCKYSTA